jgi:peptidylprolyl isomerase
VATNKQREASRRQLEQQLRDRQAQEARRKRMTLIGSVVGTLVLIGVVVGIIAATTGGGKGKGGKAQGANATKPSHGASPANQSTAPVPCGQAQLAPVQAKPVTGPAVTFDGVTVKGAADLAGKPIVTSHGTAPVVSVEVKDLVIGKGAKATDTSCVNVQYDGVLYKNGTEFDSSWKRGTPAQFSLAQVVKGFTYGIGGTQTVGTNKGIPPMRVGGRRIIIVPAADGYGSQASNGIPANSDLVFVVDLLKVTAGQ